MAVINYTVEEYGSHALLITWANMEKGDTGKPLGKEFSEYADRSIHCFGAFDSATLTFQGSNDVVNAEASAVWATLNEPGDTALTFTADKIEQVREITRLQRPSVSGSGGSADISCALLIRRVRP